MEEKATHAWVHDETKPTNCIFYLCANDLYGLTMCQSLAVGNFKWLIDFELENCSVPCILEVDLEYPKSFTTCITTMHTMEIHMKRTKLALAKPVYCAMSILDISETLMYEFHYNFIKSKYGDRAKLLFEYTDGLA